MTFDIDLYGLISIFYFLMVKNFGKKVSEKLKKALSCGTKRPISRKRQSIAPTFYTPFGSPSRGLVPITYAFRCKSVGWPSKTRNTFFRLIIKIFDCSGLNFSIKIINQALNYQCLQLNIAI